MKKLKITLLCITILVQNLLVAAGGNKGKSAGNNQDKIMEMNALQYLNGTVKLVAPDADISMPDQEFETFMRRVTKKDDDADRLRTYFSQWRNGDVLHTQCRLPVVGEIAQKELSLRTLLKTITDAEVREAIINKVVVHSMKRESMFIKTPRGQDGKPAYDIQVPDNKDLMIATIVKLFKDNK
jgi:hypothetical protein